MRSAGRMIVDGGDDGIVLTENTCGSRRAGLGVKQLRLRVFERRYRQLPMIDQLLLLRRRERLGDIVQDPGTGSVRLIRAVFFASSTAVSDTPCAWARRFSLCRERLTRRRSANGSA